MCLPMQLMHKIQVWSLGGEDPLEEELTTHPSILPEKSHGQRSLVGYHSWTGHDWAHTSTINKAAMDIPFSSWSCYTWLIRKLVCPFTLLRKKPIVFFFPSVHCLFQSWTWVWVSSEFECPQNLSVLKHNGICSLCYQ